MEEDPTSHKEDEFVRLLTTHHDDLLRFVRTLIPNASDAEDVFQRASVSLWKKHDEFDNSRSFFSWACRFVHFEVMNYRKRVSRDRLTFSDDIIEMLAEEAVEVQPTLELRRKALESCISKLDTDDRLLLERRYSEHGSVARLSEDLNCTPRQLYKSLERLRRSLMLCVDATTKESVS